MAKRKKQRNKPSKISIFGRFEDVVFVLKRKFQLDADVVVQRVALDDGEAGHCLSVNGKYYIRINKKLSEDAAILVLCHEFAHAIVENVQLDAHSELWGVVYARVYSEVGDA